ncbi:MAG TPA: DUF4402 domain-containing protein [Bacteroidales bacterium]|nr:DUF4402 domain-containing protein [Bacteroidales bacterium]
MKKLVILFASMFIMTIAVQNVSAQDPQSATADAAANIITPMTIQKIVDLNFGNIASPAQAGTVVLGTDNSRTPTNVILPSVTGTVTAAEFTVTGLSDATYSITFPNSTTITNAGNTMTIDNYTENATNILTGGSETFKVGATLNVNADQAAGAYTGNFIVTVDYN